MPLSSNDWSAATLETTACAVVTNGACTPSRTVTCEEALLLILDKLRRGGVDISTATSSDLEGVTQFVLCALQSIPYASMDHDKLVALTLWAVNQT